MAALHSFGFYLSFFFFLFPLPILSGCRLDVCLSANLECRSEVCCTRLAENTRREKSPKNRHLHTIAQLCRAISLQLRHISTIGKNLLNNISSTCPHNMVTLTAEINRRVWGAPANVNGFRILASLLHQRQSTEVNQTLHNVWPSPGLVHYIYILGALAPWWNFSRCKIYLESKSCTILYWQHYCTALEQWTSAKLCGVVQGMQLRNFRKRRHL